MKIINDYEVEEVAENLVAMAGKSDDNEIKEECIMYLYRLKAEAENPYNADCFLVFWNTLQEILDYA